ncbi:drkD [Symbiodinium microadriaticum]|nr:drkD [Symbiodinium microadriaticum]
MEHIGSARTSEVLRRVMVIAGRCWSACFPEIRVLQGLLTWEKGPQHLEPLAPLKSLVFDKLVSEGSFGQVFGGTWCGRRVAIKVLRSESSGIEEAMLMKSLCHPNVVEAIFFAEVAHELMGMQVWLVQEFCECGTWGSHCVSPRNAWAGLCEVGDFGSACKVPNGVDKVCSKSLGTVNFLAPECLEPEGDGSMQSRERDVFAFARLMWQALTGQRPFFGCSAIQVVLLVSQGYNLELHPAVPEAFRKLYDDCAAVAPSRRPSFREILISLRAGLGRHVRPDGLGMLELGFFIGDNPSF